MVAWKERLDGGTEIGSCEMKTLVQSVMEKSDAKDQEREQKVKDVWITQKMCQTLTKCFKNMQLCSKDSSGIS